MEYIPEILLVVVVLALGVSLFVFNRTMKDLYNSVGTLKAKEKEYDRDEARALRNGARDGDDISLLRPVGGTETIKIGVNK